ncbi:MAG: hypothetical protein PUE12_15175 [Oscillospiraceae bacterium]|nr:hypothetical protein [Oscillospiraceae bacterium]
MKSFLKKSLDILRVLCFEAFRNFSEKTIDRKHEICFRKASALWCVVQSRIIVLSYGFITTKKPRTSGV